MANELAKKVDYGTQVIKRVDGLCSNGFTMPADYNHVNAIKASQLILSESTDYRTGKSLLEGCTPASIQTALFKMVTRGLDVSKGQAYFIKRGDKLTLQPSYFGNILQVKRIYPNFDPKPRVIYEGDKFEFTTDPATGKRVLVKHEQSIDNLDNDFVGAYMYIPCKNGTSDLYIMTRKQILAAWSKSTDKNQSTHKLFVDKMVSKTIVNSACTMIINSTPECAAPAMPGEDSEEFTDAEEVQEEAVSFDEVPEAEVVDMSADEQQEQEHEQEKQERQEADF